MNHPAFLAAEASQAAAHAKLAQHALRAALASARTIRAQAIYTSMVSRSIDIAKGDGLGLRDADIHTTAHIKARQVALDAFMAEQEATRALQAAIGREALRQSEADEPV